MWSKIRTTISQWLPLRSSAGSHSPDITSDSIAQKSSINSTRSSIAPRQRRSAFAISLEAHSAEEEYQCAFSSFSQHFPSYAETNALDDLRDREFTRLKDKGIIYMDYMGGCIYPESLVKDHAQSLEMGVYGNTHSDSPSSVASEQQVRISRNAVLSFFDAPPAEYVCIFTANCTGALKLVGEAFPFVSKSRFILAEDSHNSVNGIRAFARSKGADVVYLAAQQEGGFDENAMLHELSKSTHLVDEGPVPSLVAITGQSNISGFRPNLPNLLSAAKESGYYTLIDAAALASTSRISLGSTSSTSLTDLNGKVDALAVSFYKIFGYPTGVGALIARKDFLDKLKRPWFSGGTVDIVAMPYGMTESAVDWERFEEGTLNYTALMAIPKGLELVSRYLETSVLSTRLRALHSWLHQSLDELRYGNGSPLVRVLTADPNLPEQGHSYGYVLSCIFLEPSGKPIPNSEVSRNASAAGISLRTGCVCNPGGAIGLLGLREEWTRIRAAIEGKKRVGYQDLQCMLGWEVGVVRISLGLASDFRDVWEIVRFAIKFMHTRFEIDKY